jgi:hypothetical protein
MGRLARTLAVIVGSCSTGGCFVDCPSCSEDTEPSGSRAVRSTTAQSSTTTGTVRGTGWSSALCTRATLASTAGGLPWRTAVSPVPGAKLPAASSTSAARRVQRASAGRDAHTPATMVGSWPAVGTVPRQGPGRARVLGRGRPGRSRKGRLRVDAGALPHEPFRSECWSDGLTRCQEGYPTAQQPCRVPGCTAMRARHPVGPFGEST